MRIPKFGDGKTGDSEPETFATGAAPSDQHVSSYKTCNNMPICSYSYLSDGRCYTKEVENLDIPLRHLFDWAKERKQEEDQQLSSAETCQNFAHFRGYF